MRALASFFLELGGWRFEGELPHERRYVVLAVPHTSNWDGALLLTFARSIDLPIKWMIKGGWVRGPLGIALRRLGAVAIDRSKAHNVVDAMVDEFRRQDDLALIMPPEGTRSRADYWKSGFYHIARGAEVPVVPGYLDYKRKVAGFGAPIRLTGDVVADMNRIRAFYNNGNFTARFPTDVGPIRLREESELPVKSQFSE